MTTNSSNTLTLIDVSSDQATRAILEDRSAIYINRPGNNRVSVFSPETSLNRHGKPDGITITQDQTTVVISISDNAFLIVILVESNLLNRAWVTTHKPGFVTTIPRVVGAIIESVFALMIKTDPIAHKHILPIRKWAKYWFASSKNLFL
ncbi:hypothetical protein IC620_10905 [Hazenella sp. IB182357]|uniref:Uncharacterized protein n=1 Tax=Polycladospora coralii TaxID=2771432 RepID=A0A926NBR5_9BACL|nr:hypothetical protein [Polycladospora coralii]MBD1372865.1 hypothetical protein [Polycladospora coralii]MBS7529446.1 hypothetical protein [Polycladospora coralii]